MSSGTELDTADWRELAVVGFGYLPPWQRRHCGIACDDPLADITLGVLRPGQHLRDNQWQGDMVTEAPGWPAPVRPIGPPRGLGLARRSHRRALLQRLLTLLPGVLLVAWVVLGPGER